MYLNECIDNLILMSYILLSFLNVINPTNLTGQASDFRENWDIKFVRYSQQ